MPTVLVNHLTTYDKLPILPSLANTNLPASLFQTQAPYADTNYVSSSKVVGTF